MKSFSKIFCVLLLSFFLLLPSAFATPLQIVNPSFELPVDHPVYYDPALGSETRYQDIPGWDYSGSSLTRRGVWSPSESFWNTIYNTPIPDGNSLGYLNGGSFSQLLTHTLSVDNLITVSLDIGNRFGMDFPEYDIQLWAGDSSNILISSNAARPENGYFETLTMDYLVEADELYLGQSLGITIFSSGSQLNFDNLRITNDGIDENTAPVPEPATLLMLGSGLIGLAGAGRKKLFKK